MNIIEASFMRIAIEEQINNHPKFLDIKERLNKIGISLTDDWLLSVEELMAIPMDDVPICFMSQMAKLYKLCGIPAQEADFMAIEAYGNIK